ncbi:hypothetical protein AV540_21610 [Brevibacillus parabrevis]|uniref:DUF3221 domain-containing protein n=1 Tax=Brevibacillus parabrevis TaxID=54914 RepID=UPI0007AB67FF|nr:DUF3221 domain-containing protein [Brevibacillus parabrevis]KZE46906.1 hypothetical protein AV540_21610 [Brevibacillus parabrevis]
MNKYLMFITLSTIVLLTVGCSAAKPKNEHKGLTGFVIEANYEKRALLVAESDKTSATEGKYGVEWYSLNDDAILVDSKNSKVLFTDIEVGSEVETWSTSPSLESYPSKTDLSKLVVADDVKHPNSDMLQKKAIQAALNFAKNLSDKPAILIVQKVEIRKTDWLIHVYNFDLEKSYGLRVNPETAEVSYN